MPLSERQKQFIDEIAVKEGFKYYKVDLNQGSLKGDGYMGVITVVKIEETMTKRTLHLIMKSAHRRDDVRNKAQIPLAYERENFMYGVVFQEFALLQKDLNVKQLFDGTAKYFGGLKEDKEECLLLDNLRENGFKMWDRKKAMDSHHVGAVMAQYGKFHALSYALKKLKPEKFEEITKNLKDIFEGKLSEDDLKNSSINSLEKALKSVEGNSEAIAGLKRYAESSKVFFHQILRLKDKYTVIRHGDCWANNMMFKYEDSMVQRPVKVYLLDWQLSSTGSPVTDLAYFFYACSSKLCMDNYNSYLKIYHDSLSEMLKQLGVKVEEIMTFKELQTQWKIYAKYGLHMAILILNVMLAEKGEAQDLGDIAKNNSIMELFNGYISNGEEYNRRLSIVINHMVKNRFI